MLTDYSYSMESYFFELDKFLYDYLDISTFKWSMPLFYSEFFFFFSGFLLMAAMMFMF